MVESITKKYYMQIVCILINTAFALSIWAVCQIGGIVTTFLGFIVCLLYLMFFITLSSYKKVYYYFYNVLMMYFVITMTYRKAWGKMAIDWLQFENVLLLVFILYLCFHRNRVRNRRDIVPRIWILFTIFFSMVSLVNGNSVWNIICVAFIYLRTLPVYYVVANGDRTFDKKDLIFFLIVNAIPMPIEAVYYSVDDFSGLYGMLGVTPLSIMAVFLYGLSIGAYVNGKIRTIKFALLNILFYGFCIIGEVKFAIFMCPILEIIIVFMHLKIKDQKNKFGNKLLAMISIPGVFVTAYAMLLRFNTKWVERINRSGGLINYLIYYSMEAKVLTQYSKMELHLWALRDLLSSVPKKLFGLGIGSAMPNEACQIEFRDYYLGRYRSFFSPYLTDFYERFSYLLGYHTTTSGVVLIETGIVGLALYACSFFIIMYRAWRLTKREQIEDRMIGFAGLLFTIYLIPVFVYYNVILRIQMITTVMLVFGLVSRYYFADEKQVTIE